MIVRKPSKRVLFLSGFTLWASLSAAPVWAAAAESAVPEFSWWGYIQAILIMILVLAALGGAVWLLRRSGRFAGMPRGTLPRSSLFVEGQLSLAPRKGVVVVRFLNKRLVLGVTEQQISLLTETDLNDAQPTFSECLDAAGKKDPD